MKSIKITISIIALALLSWGGYSLYSKRITPVKVLTAPNSFVKEIKDKIVNLSQLPLNTFCIDTYKDIKYDIGGFKDAGKIDPAWEDNLLKDLEYAYTAIFIKQAYNVFSGTTWETGKLSIIQSESNRLSSSPYIADKSELLKIQSVLAKYNEIISFIAGANRFAASVNVVSYAQIYEVNTAGNYISKSQAYSNTGGSLIRCNRLKAGLNAIPNQMYKSHLNYLTKKVNFSTYKYTTFANYNDYYTTIYSHVLAEFETFKNTCPTNYSVSVSAAQNAIDGVEAEMVSDNSSANYHFKSKLKLN